MSAGWAGGTVKVWADLRAQGPQCLTVCSRTSHPRASGCPVPIRSGPDPGGGGRGHPNAALGIRLQPLPPCPCPPVVQQCRARSNFACSTSEGKFLPPPPEQHRQLQPSSKLFNEQAFILAQLIHFARLLFWVCFFFFPQKCIYLLRPEVPGDALPARPALPSTPDPLIAIPQQLSEARVKSGLAAPPRGPGPHRAPRPRQPGRSGLQRKKGGGGGEERKKRKKEKNPSNPTPPRSKQGTGGESPAPGGRSRRCRFREPLQNAPPPPPRVLTPAPKGSRGDVEPRRCSGDHRTNGEPCSRLAAAWQPPEATGAGERCPPRARPGSASPCPGGSGLRGQQHPLLLSADLGEDAPEVGARVRS
ncbi:WAS/WASL-interacting protein family member 1-like isoform X2 [Haliaeetus albicilla]|uniref:WAS/WASL-interacting protein family member 1-like isoform X2 n=1 Tax=Haliaeetus albicilla TaxID=8969 RepID=UPI0037E75102